MTDIEMTDEELGLVKRVLAFASQDVPITDFLGNKIFPTYATRTLAAALEEKLAAAGIATPAQLYTAYDPHALVNQIATVRWFNNEGVEYNVHGRVVDVHEAHEADENGNKGYTVLFAGGDDFHFKSRDELQQNSRVELATE